MSTVMIWLFIEACWQTILMVALSCAMAVLLGVPLGIVLLVTRKKHLYLIQPLIVSYLSCQWSSLYTFYYFNGGHYSFYPVDCGNFHRYRGSNRAFNIGCHPFVGRMVEGAWNRYHGD